MKKILSAIIITLLLSLGVNAQTPVFFSACENVTAFDTLSTPDLGIVIHSGDAETVWNAMRLANYSRSKGDEVAIFVIGKGVDAFMREQDKSDTFNVQDISNTYLNQGGNIFLCATCAKVRETDDIQSCTITSIADMYEIIKRSKKVISF